jgi:DNA-binding transcriptional MocR family regulator
VSGAPSEPSLVIAGRSRSLRRSLGLTAWAALEDLLLDASLQAPGRLCARASSRELAARLGVSKDTAAAALRRLTLAGPVQREDHRDTTRGVFARSVYVIDAARLDKSGIRRQTAQPTRSTRRGSVAVAAGHSDGQASLFDLVAPEQP